MGRLARRSLLSFVRQVAGTASSGTTLGFPEWAGLGARAASIAPDHTVYQGPSTAPANRVTIRTLRQKYQRREPISMVTAYDYPSAVHVDLAGIDILLVGDSAAMVVHGHDTTIPITTEDLLVHCKAVGRGAKRAFLLGDLPFGSYESSPEQAVHTATRFMKEGGMDAVKLEGGSVRRVAAAKAVVEAGIAVMGHIGLAPQMISVIGGFRPQGQSAAMALKILEEGRALEQAGCFALLTECIPPPVSAALQKCLSVPTIGIGAGPACSGQVLVYHDLLGFMQHPHHAKVTPKFCKQYCRVGDVIQKALGEFRAEVESGMFPSPGYSPYKMKPEELEKFAEGLRKGGRAEAADAAESEYEKHQGEGKKEASTQ